VVARSGCHVDGLRLSRLYSRARCASVMVRSWRRGRCVPGHADTLRGGRDDGSTSYSTFAKSTVKGRMQDANLCAPTASTPVPASMTRTAFLDACSRSVGKAEDEVGRVMLDALEPVVAEVCEGKVFVCDTHARYYLDGRAPDVTFSWPGIRVEIMGPLHVAAVLDWKADHMKKREVKHKAGGGDREVPGGSGGAGAPADSSARGGKLLTDENLGQVLKYGQSVLLTRPVRTAVTVAIADPGRIAFVKLTSVPGLSVDSTWVYEVSPEYPWVVQGDTGGFRRLCEFLHQTGEAVREVETLATSCPGYTLQRELGHGTSGVVYQAIRNGTDTRVAVKVFRSGPAGCTYGDGCRCQRVPLYMKAVATYRP
jgi:hypothetical protein